MAKKRTGVAQWIAEAAVPMLVLDRRWRVRVFNRGAQELTGRETGEVIGQTARFTSEPGEVTPGSVQELLAAIAPSPAEFRGEVASGRVMVPTDTVPVSRRALYLPLEVPDEKDVHLLIALLDESRVPVTARVASHHGDLAAARLDHRQRHRIERLIATDPSMERPLRQFDVARRCDASLHITGPLGSGRVTFAAQVHNDSARGEESLMVVEIERPRRPSQIATLEAVLSTDPGSPPPPGTLVLAEVDRLPLDVQAEFVNWYADAESPAPRLITTATRSRADLIDAGETLHPEFAALIGTIAIDLPPLQERPGDLPLLAQAVIERTLLLSGERQPSGLRDDTLDLLSSYGWPGNVGELDGCIEAAVRRGTGPLITPDDLPLSFATGQHAESLGAEQPLPPLQDVLHAAERAHLEAALQRSGGSKAGAAKLLGMSRPKLYRRLDALGITPGSVHQSQTGGS